MKKINLNEIKKVLTRDQLKKVNAGSGGSNCNSFNPDCRMSPNRLQCCVCRRCC